MSAAHPYKIRIHALCNAHFEQIGSCPCRFVRFTDNDETTRELPVAGHDPGEEEPDPYGLIAGGILETAYLAGKSGKLCGVSLMMIGGAIASVQRIAVWIIMYALAGYAAAKRG